MTFEQAGMEFARLQQAWRAGQVTPEQYQAALAALRVTDAQGRCWQPDPATGQWLYWNGAAWCATQPQAPPAPVPAPAPARPAAGGGAFEGLISLLPGIGIQLFQRWSVYKTNPMAAVQFLAPALVSALAMALVGVIGRVAAILLVLGCLVWLSWPVISGWAGLAADPAVSARDNAGLGLTGLSMLYMIPRLWRAGAR